MEIETKRLRILALNANQLSLWIEDCKGLERKLTISEKSGLIDGFFKEIVKNQLEITRNDVSNYVWHTFWLIIRKEDNVVVGAIDFKDVPNEKGEVEIGYGLGIDFEHNGYMTETVEALCEWGKNQEGVKAIIAETDLDGIKSQNILKRCGFIEYSRGETLWWRIDK